MVVTQSNIVIGMKNLAVAGIVFIVIGLLIVFYGLVIYNPYPQGAICPLQYYNEKAPCGNVPPVIPSIGIAIIIVGAILLALSFRNPFTKQLPSMNEEPSPDTVIQVL